MKRRFDSSFLICGHRRYLVYERQLQLAQSPKNYNNLIFRYGVICVAKSGDVSVERNNK